MVCLPLFQRGLCLVPKRAVRRAAGISATVEQDLKSLDSIAANASRKHREFYIDALCLCFCRFVRVVCQPIGFAPIDSTATGQLRFDNTVSVTTRLDDVAVTDVHADMTAHKHAHARLVWYGADCTAL